MAGPKQGRAGGAPGKASAARGKASGAAASRRGAQAAKGAAGQPAERSAGQGGKAGQGVRTRQDARAGQRSRAAQGGKAGQPADGARPGQPRYAQAAAEGAASAKPADAPRWLQLSTFILSLAGLGASIYLTIAHYTQTALAGCPANATFNCTKVTTSPESIVFGIPVAVLGLAFYVFLVAINSPWAWRSDLAVIRWVRLGSMIAGIVFVLYLIYVELFKVNAICEYCTGVHIITFLLFGLIMFHTASWSAAKGKAARR